MLLASESLCHNFFAEFSLSYHMALFSHGANARLHYVGDNNSDLIYILSELFIFKKIYKGNCFLHFILILFIFFIDRYFRGDLEVVARRAECDCIFGPPVFIFHDTRHTNVLTEGNLSATLFRG